MPDSDSTFYEPRKQAGYVEGLAPGRKVADSRWPMLRAHFEGTAPHP